MFKIKYYKKSKGIIIFYLTTIYLLEIFTLIIDKLFA